MQHHEFEPPIALRDTIKCFWYTKIALGEQQTSFEVQPDGYAEIIFHFGSECSIAYNGGLQQLPSPFMMGLLDQPIIFHAKRQLEIIGIRCFPWTVFDLLGLPPDRDGVRMFKHPITQLQATLNKWMNVGKIDEAVTEVKQYFLNTRPQMLDELLAKAGHAMMKTNGTMPVSKIAAAAHATVRTLERKFKQSSGHSVKDVSGLMRFEQVRNHLWLHPNCNLAGLAQEPGYADQSHLSKEFKRYSGSTPAAFARKTKELAITNNFVAFVQA